MINRIQVLLVGLSLCFVAGAQDSEFDEALACWREYIIAVGPVMDFGHAFNSSYCTELRSMGPNILPELAEVYAAESDPFMLKCYANLFKHVGGFGIYRYTEQSLKIRDRDFMDDGKGEMPFLNSKGVGPLLAREERDLFLQWWDQRGVFLERKGVVEELRAISGKTSKEFEAYDWNAVQAFDKHAVI